jgi:hypothetical protein
MTPAAETKNQQTQVYLLEDYHSGADGRVWLACNAEGHLLVIKLSTDRQYEQEARAWRDIWQCDGVRATRLMDANALLMPFAFHGVLCSSHPHSRRRIHFRSLSHWREDEEDLSVEDILESSAVNTFDEQQLRGYYEDPWRAAEEAVRAMAAKGYEHLDLRWRHVALLPVPPSPADTDADIATGISATIGADSVTATATGAATDDALPAFPAAMWRVRPILIDLHRVRVLTEE